MILLCLDDRVTLFEFLDDFIVGGDLLSHPGVANDVYQVEALSRVELEHVRDQVFELLTEEALSLGLSVVLPE